MDNLIKLKLSPNNMNDELLNDVEFADQKRKINLETQTFKNIVDNLEDQVDEWIDASQKCLEFAKVAQNKWVTGTADDKRTILNAVGSKIILKDKMLTISAREPFLLIQNAVKNTMCTPTRTGSNFETLSVLGHLVNDVRTYYITAENKERERIKALIYQELPLLEQMPIVQNNF